MNRPPCWKCGQPAAYYGKIKSGAQRCRCKNPECPVSTFIPGTKNRLHVNRKKERLVNPILYTRRKKLSDKTLQQCRGILEATARRVAKAQGRQAETIELPDTSRISGEQAMLIKRSAYPECPGCGSAERVIRAGVVNGYQRYRCKTCKGRTFAGPGVVRAISPKNTRKLICHRCGNDKALSKGRDLRHGNNARRGWCQSCQQYFMQGGYNDLEHNHLYLRERIKALNLPPELREELYQQASEAVLKGDGYCWSVPLDLRAVRKAVFGEWGQGSDHPKYREANGLKPKNWDD